MVGGVAGEGKGGRVEGERSVNFCFVLREVECFAGSVKNWKK